MNFAEAKEKSLNKWSVVLEAYPDLKKMAILENEYSCGFCEYFDPATTKQCEEKCPLCPNYCAISRRDTIGIDYNNALYWEIAKKISTYDKEGLKEMIEELIKAIENAEERQ